MDAHVTADATEQWIRLALKDGVPFDPVQIAARVPDCGYKLRRIELEATGRLEGDAFVVDSSKQRFELSSPPETLGHGVLRARFEAPVAQPPELIFDAFELRKTGALPPR